MCSTMSISVASDRHCRYICRGSLGFQGNPSSRRRVCLSLGQAGIPSIPSASLHSITPSFLPPSLPLPFDDEQWETLSLHFTISAVQHKAAQQPTRSLAQPVEKREIVNMRIMDVCQVVRILAHYVNRISSKRRAAKLRGAFRGRCSLATAALCRPFLSLNQSNPNKKLS